MSVFKKIGNKLDISYGKIKEYKIEGKIIAVANINGKYLAFDGLCPHLQCPLAGGSLKDDIITCYCHGAKFDITNGKVISGPTKKPLQVYKVKTEGEDILVKL